MALQYHENGKSQTRHKAEKEIFLIRFPSSRSNAAPERFLKSGLWKKAFPLRLRLDIQPSLCYSMDKAGRYGPRESAAGTIPGGFLFAENRRHLPRPSPRPRFSSLRKTAPAVRPAPVLSRRLLKRPVLFFSVIRPGKRFRGGTAVVSMRERESGRGPDRAPDRPQGISKGGRHPSGRPGEAFQGKSGSFGRRVRRPGRRGNVRNAGGAPDLADFGSGPWRFRQSVRPDGTPVLSFFRIAR